MKTFIAGLFAAAAVLFLAPAARADIKPKAPASQQADVEVDGQKVRTIKLNENGTNSIFKLPSGHKVTLELKNGKPVMAQAIDGKGGNLPTTVKTEGSAAARVIIIIIRDGGTVIIIVIRQRVA
jgi:hypothetical protein